MNMDQDNLVEQLVYVIAPQWSSPMTGRLAIFSPLPERLDGIIHSLLTELGGDGGVDRCRLAAKSRPDVDLLALEWSPTHAYPLLGARPPVGVPAELVALLVAIEQRRDTYQGTTDTVRAVVGDFIGHVLFLIEQGFELTPIYTNEAGRPVGEGDDIAPGLSEAFRQAWPNP